MSAIRVLESAPDDEQCAFWRMIRANDVLVKRSDDEWLPICGGVLDPQPGDEELLGRWESRVPAEAWQRLRLAAKAARAVGLQ